MNTGLDLRALVLAAALTILSGAAAFANAQDEGSLLEQVAGCWGIEIGGWTGERLPRDMVVPPFVRLDTTHAFPDDAESGGEQARRVLYPPRLETDQYQSTWILTAQTDSVVMRWGVARGSLAFSMGRELDALVGRARYVSGELDADAVSDARVRARRLNPDWCERQVVRMDEAAEAAAQAAALVAQAEAARMDSILAEVAAAEGDDQAEVPAAAEGDDQAAVSEGDDQAAVPVAAAGDDRAAVPAAEPDDRPAEPAARPPTEGAATEAIRPAAARPRQPGPIRVRLAATVVSRGTAALPANYDDIWDIRTDIVDAIAAELALDGNIDLYVPLEGIDPFNDSFHPPADYVAELVLGYFEARDALITEARLRLAGSDEAFDEWTGPGSIDAPAEIEDRVVDWFTERIRALP